MAVWVKSKAGYMTPPCSLYVLLKHCGGSNAHYIAGYCELFFSNEMKRVNKPLRGSDGRAETVAKRYAKIASKRTFIHRSVDWSRLEGGGE